MTYSKDYELVRAIQNGDRLSRLALFTVYKRLVKRVAKMALLPQDFEQEAFEIMVAAVDKVDLSRIKNPEDWGFYLMFYRALLKGMLKSNKIEFAEIKLRSRVPAERFTGDHDGIDDGSRRSKSNFSLMKMVNPSLFDRYSPQAEIFRDSLDEVYKNFMSGCSPVELKIIDLRQRGASIADTARRVGLSYVDTHDVIDDLKQRLNHMMSS